MQDTKPAAQDLRERRAHLIAQLPALDQVIRGSLFERTRRCGTPSCHCATGEGHATTYLGVTLGPGKTEQVTVPRDLVPVVRGWTENYQRLWSLLEEVSTINRELLRQRDVASRVKGPQRRGRRS